MPGRKVLCVSFDKLVSDSRRAALEQREYSVTSTTKAEEAMELVGHAKFDVVVVGHRFPKEDRRALASLAQKTGARVVLVCGAGPDADIPADARVYALQGAEGIVSASEKLLAAAQAA